MIKNQNTSKSFSKHQHSFAVAESSVTRERSTFSRPSRTITAIDGGFLYPILVDEVLPGDTFQLRANLMGWLATPLKPFLDNLIVSTFFFFIPHRLVWENWAKFQGEKINPGDTTTYTIPQIDIGGGIATGLNKLADFMGLPLNALAMKVSALPFRGYNLVWNDYFRDTNLQDSIVVDIDDADSTEADYVIKKRGRRKDYLTGCLPWPQRPGDGLTPGIISGVVPVTSTGVSILLEDESANESRIEINGAAGVSQEGSPDLLDQVEELRFGSVTGLEADLSTAQANTINQLRQSIAIQQLLELDARGGTRHPEQIKARFGVTSADARLQRPEYLGGGSTNVSVTPVPATAFNAANSINIGDLSGFGNANGSVGGFTHSFTEHGYVLGLINLRTDYTYFEGVQRHWSRLTRYDFAEPALMHLGEQPVYNREIFVSNVDVDDFGPLGVWGYQERFSEYKYGNSMCTSIMRPNADTTVAYWHLAEEFTTQLTLNDAFIQDNPPIDRVVTVVDEPHLLVDIWFANKTTRVMPVHNTPGLTRL